MKKRVLIIASLLMVAVFLVSCGQKKDSKEKGDDEAKEKYLVVLKVQSSEFWQSMQKGVEDKAKELGVDVKITSAQTEDDVEGQVTAMESEMANNYTGIAVAPLTSDNLIKPIVEANESGVLVTDIDEAVNMDGLAKAGGSLVSFVTTDNVLVGKTAGKIILDEIGEGKVAIIEGKAGAASGEDRKEGARTELEDGGLEIVESQPADWDRTRAYDLATNIISKQPDLKAIYACNDTMALGAQEAVENSGKEIIVVGTDGNSDAIDSVKAGKLFATVGQDPAEIGGRSLELLVNAVHAGEKPGDKPITTELIDPIPYIRGSVK